MLSPRWCGGPRTRRRSACCATAPPRRRCRPGPRRRSPRPPGADGGVDEVAHRAGQRFVERAQPRDLLGGDVLDGEFQHPSTSTRPMSRLSNRGPGACPSPGCNGVGIADADLPCAHGGSAGRHRAVLRPRRLPPRRRHPSAAAALWFNRGLVWAYAFNHGRPSAASSGRSNSMTVSRSPAGASRMRSDPTTTRRGRRSTPPTWRPRWRGPVRSCAARLRVGPTHSNAA